MQLQSALITATEAILPMFGLSPRFSGQEKIESFITGNEINVLLGLAGSVRGSVVLGFSHSLALNVVSAMMGGIPVPELDDMGKSAVAELANMLFGTALGHLGTGQPIELSPPTLIMGQQLSLLISQLETTRLKFLLEPGELLLSYCTEQIVT